MTQTRAITVNGRAMLVSICIGFNTSFTRSGAGKQNSGSINDTGIIKIAYLVWGFTDHNDSCGYKDLNVIYGSCLSEWAVLTTECDIHRLPSNLHIINCMCKNYKREP